MNFKVGTLRISTSQPVRPDWPVWVENLKGDNFEIHNLFLFLTVLGDHWELEARKGTVRKPSFNTFRKQTHFSFLKTFFGWKMWKTNRSLPQNTTFSVCELAISQSKWPKWSRIIENRDDFHSTRGTVAAVVILSNFEANRSSNENSRVGLAPSLSLELVLVNRGPLPVVSVFTETTFRYQKWKCADRGFNNGLVL